MPKRPRSHVLESLSKRAFEDSLPEHWIVRWESIDYGIDGTVELVEDDGTVTGQVFAVQVKSTDGAGEPHVRIGSTALFYYSVYSLPVLLVMYTAPSARLHVHWVDDLLNSVPPETLRKWRSQDSVAVSFGDEHEIGTVGVETLAARTGQFLSTRPRRPLVNVFIQDFEAGPNDPPIRSPDGMRNQLYDEISDWIARILPGRVHVIDDEERADVVVGPTTENQTAELSVRLTTPDVLSPDLVTWTGPVREIPYWVTDPTEPTRPGAHVLLAIGYAMGGKGDVGSAAQLLLLTAPKCAAFLEADSVAALSLATFLASGHREADAVILAEDLVAQGHVDLAADLLMVPVFARAGSPSLAEAISRVQASCIARTNDEAARGMRSYNLANAMRGRSDFRGAVKAYLAARRDEPTYAQRHYWWRELGGCFFALGRFKWAADSYEMALSCDVPETPAVADAADPKEAARRYWLTPIKGLHADALFHAGRYKEAAAAFEEYRAEAGEPNGEWLLTEMLLIELLGEELVSDGPRRTSEALAAAPDIEELIDAGNFQEARELIGQSIRLDPLEPEIWHLSEMVDSQLGDTGSLVFSQAMLAITSGSLGPWIAATVNSFNREAGGMHVMVALTLSGFQKFGTRFLEGIAHKLRAEVGMTAEQVEPIKASLRMIVDREFTLAEARASGIPIPEEMGDGPIPLFLKE